ncbi:uncharacterized protein Z518_01137 [Rhinocladiella mackenziei CBS 650.93]|uniref:Uncharacterized protein n=1 Tax=Rhinocladiella mackenziei CBS 650.93 TaxID=1442369 RepID=A0A0D2J331_9EURO|nr:uncharacterized protein Z518_01137 [Rhinocladiella mackenziei CBS 650.93]KIX10056.1 hypothetical protein Z518_01137 [Rhinocladiella mackenziei CBS 650.93]
MAAIDRSCLFCKKSPWDNKELELLNWYSANLNGRLDTRICNFHNQKQIDRLPEVRNRIQQETKKRTAPVEEAKQRIYMDHYREMQADQKTAGCCIVM